jgi:hypothetical protein
MTGSRELVSEQRARGQQSFSREDFSSMNRRLRDIRTSQYKRHTKHLNQLVPKDESEL